MNATLVADPGVAGMDFKGGHSASAGTFTGGDPVIGLESGIILSTGGVKNVEGTNTTELMTQNNGLAGNATLDGLTGGFTTNDATVLDFDFVANSSTLQFQYVFASDEFNEWKNTRYNDVFAFFVDGQNIALLPNSNGPQGPVSINNSNLVVNNSQFFINNDLASGLPRETEMDGLTTVLTATATVNPGQTYHIKLAIADASDHLWDSNVFIKLLNRSPILTVNAPTVTVGEGSVATISGAFSDADGDAVALTVSKGNLTAGSGTWSWSYTTLDGPADTGPVTIYANDGESPVKTVVFDLIVNNLQPSALTIAIPPASMQAIDDLTGKYIPGKYPWNTSLPFTFTANDPSTVDKNGKFTYVINWGDGNVQTVPNQNFQTQISHQYVHTAANPIPIGTTGKTFNIFATVQDKDGAWFQGVTNPGPLGASNQITIVRATAAVLNPDPFFWPSPDGNQVCANLFFHDPDPDPSLLYSWDFDNDGIFGESDTINGNETAVTSDSQNVGCAVFTANAVGVYDVYLQVTDPATESTTTHFLIIEVVNAPPTIDSLLVPATSTKGSLTSFLASASDLNGDELTYDWSVTLPDGGTLTFTGPAPDFTPTAFGLHKVDVDVSDGVNHTVGSAFMHVFPAVTTNNLISPDPSPSLVGTVDDADLTVFVSVHGLTFVAQIQPLNEAGVYPWILPDNIIPTLENGTYEIAVFASDGLGNTKSAVSELVVAAVQEGGVAGALVPDPLDPTKNMVFVQGTSEADKIQITLADKAGSLLVSVWNGTVFVPTFSYDVQRDGPISRIVVHAGDGDDDIQIAGSVFYDSWLYGEGGNDRLKGGAGENVLLGGEGDDLILGGGTRNLLIGGTGADSVRGNGGDDILIAGFTDYDGDETALDAIITEWSKTFVANDPYQDYLARRDRLTSADSDFQYKLTASSVHNDTDADKLTGSSGFDLFFAQLAEISDLNMNGQKKQEFFFDF
ncbi:MAG: choice-of-anchor L domain-containing protein [Gemmataceae bacterium]|nr:choice-of-anchor L domain-containing protein [Gemmataceae bacterium]